MVIAVDGPAGAGKSTVCRIIAEKLGYAYLDTGSMYRAVAWSLLQNGFPVEDESRIAQSLPRLPLRFTLENDTLVITHRGQWLNEELRQPEVSQWASRISQFAPVRSFLTDWQRRLAAMGSIVAEGRDMTTVVFPDAPIKVFLTADLSTRTRRRLNEYRDKKISIDYSTLEAQIRERDKADAERSLAPLKPAPDAIVLDTSQMEIAEVVNRLLDCVHRELKPSNPDAQD